MFCTFWLCAWRDVDCTYLFEKGNLTFSDFESSSGISIKNTEWDIIEWISSSIESIKFISRNETNDGNLNDNVKKLVGKISRKIL